MKPFSQAILALLAIASCCCAQTFNIPPGRELSQLEIVLRDEARPRPLPTSCIEQDLGCVLDSADPKVAIENRIKINNALAAGVCLTMPAKELFIIGELRQPPKVGGVFVGVGGRGYQLGSYDFKGDAPLGLAVSRITRLDGENGGAVFRLCGSGFRLENVVLNGRPIPQWALSATGTKTTYGILLEGRIQPASGMHFINNVTVCQAGYFGAALSGFVNDVGEFEPTNNHADQTTWGICIAHGCDGFFLLDNINAVCHRFIEIQFTQTGDNPAGVIIDAKNGGNVHIDYLVANHRNVTLIRNHSYSHNTDSFVIEDGRLDTFVEPCDRCNATGKVNGAKCPHRHCDGGYRPMKRRFIPYEYLGPAVGRYQGPKLRIGLALAGPTSEDLFECDVKLNGMPGGNISLDIHHLPEKLARQYPWGGSK